MMFLQAFVDFMYPPVCLACGQPLVAGETTLCTDCRVHLPYTSYERWTANPAAQVFYGRVPLRGAAALLFFMPDGRVQHLLHLLKYKHRPDLGVYLGGLMGRRMGRSGFYGRVDYIVPVPLHPDKLKKRGYNQAALLGQGMAAAWGQCVSGRALGKEVALAGTADKVSSGGFRPPVLLTDLLFKRRMNESQTRKNRSARWDNVQGAYGVSGRADLRARVAGKHLLLVDDVLTTGATLESVASALLAACPDISLSVAVAATPA